MTSAIQPGSTAGRVTRVLVAVALLLSQAVAAPTRSQRECAIKAVVELVALRELAPGTFTTGMRVLSNRSYAQGAQGGSGTIVDPSGIILTNAHVVTSKNPGGPSPLVEVRVTESPDQASRPAYLAIVAQFDAKSDLAVLRIVSDIAGKPVAGLNLPTIPLGSSDDLLPGDNIAVIGYPAVGGQTITYTAGYVSGFVGENYTGPGRGFIKTDAKISTGASGGAAIDSEGRLIAIPTALYFDKQGGAPQESQNYLRPVSLAVPLLERAGANGPQLAASRKP
jgi:serine protease Do